MPRKPAEQTETPAPAKSPARIKVLERRLQNPLGAPAEEIRFKEPNRRPRWFNAAIVADKIWRAKHNGWSVTYPQDLLDLDQIGGYDLSPAGGHIVRGDRGQEVLMWMPDEDYKQIAWAKTRVNMQSVGSGKLKTDEVAQAAAQQFGSQAGDYLSKTHASITDTHEIIEQTESPE